MQKLLHSPAPFLGGWHISITVMTRSTSMSAACVCPRASGNHEHNSSLVNYSHYIYVRAGPHLKNSPPNISSCGLCHQLPSLVSVWPFFLCSVSFCRVHGGSVEHRTNGRARRKASSHHSHHPISHPAPPSYSSSHPLDTNHMCYSSIN